MSRDFDHYVVNLLNEDPDYVVDVLQISSWELIKAFPVKVRHFIEDEYNVRPEDSGDFSDSEEDPPIGSLEPEEWTDGPEADDD